MKYNKIDSSLFIKNRKNFVKKLESNSIAFFNSNDIYPISADSTLPFEQHRDIFYLSGIDQEESILVLFPDSKKNSFKEMLFIRETNDHITHWEGEKLTKEKAKDISGINNIYWTNEFENILLEDGSTIILEDGFHITGDSILFEANSDLEMPVDSLGGRMMSESSLAPSEKADKNVVKHIITKISTRFPLFFFIFLYNFSVTFGKFLFKIKY